jgi:hypothetical protein
VPWGYFQFRLDTVRAAEFRGLQTDATGVMRAAHALLGEVPLPGEGELRVVFALAWHDVTTGVVTEDDFPGLRGRDAADRARRMAWRHMEAYLPRRTVRFGAEADEDGSRRWYQVSRLFAGDAEVYVREERENNGSRDWLSAFVFVQHTGDVTTRVRSPHPLAGCNVTDESVTDETPESASGAGGAAGASAGEAVVVRMPSDTDVLVTGEPAQRFLAGYGDVIVGDLEYALEAGTWRGPDSDEEDEEGTEW